MAKVASAGLAPGAGAATCEPKELLAFECKCGCDLFRMDVAIQENFEWYTILRGAACGKSNLPTEPITNGPH